MERNERDQSLNRERHLYRLKELDDYKVANDDPDVRGWEIVDRDNRKFGTIDELIVDPAQERVRYLDVDPSSDDLERRDGHLLIPIGAARIDENDHKVIVSQIDREMLSSYPAVSGNEISRDYEHDVVDRFNRPATTTRERREGPDFYNHDLYDEERFYTNRGRTRGL